MARNEAKVRLRLDGSQARGELRDVVKDAEATSGRVSEGVRKAIRGGMGIARGIGLGAGIGAGVSAIRGATESGVGDVVGEALGGIGLDLERLFLGDLPDTAKGERRAREETVQAFGAIVGQTGVVPPAAQNFYQQVRGLRIEEEKGARLLAENLPRSSNVTDLVDRIMEGFGTLISQAVDALADKLNPVSKK